MHGDWHLALLSYNWGEGSVQRAVNRNLAAGLPIDFNTLSAQMPNETRNYVPKLQAVKNIIANPAAFDIALPKVDNQPYFVTIGKTRNIDVKVAAQLAELSLDLPRSLSWSVMISDGELFVTDERGQHEIPLEWLAGQR